MSTPEPRPAPALHLGGGYEVKPVIREWHTLSPDEQQTEWADLVDWVIWIHDLYELSREERLPLCWPRHPGLVEELRSLKVWREAVYGTPDAPAHTARSWHGELRQTIAATASFWAPSCRAGHTDAAVLTDAHPELAKAWHEAGPPATPGRPTVTGPTAGAREISDAAMADALANGRAMVHSKGMPFYTNIDGTWWTRADDSTTWLRCTDPAHHAHLDTTAARMRAAEAARDNLNL
ncbi:hypothetical protein Cs7R123_32560 [Catellatospora sp. TT07R-123]|uniref:hypothetical protein n=1 Tax=Catellatospora sp. TT07R-123 TaxID=2733863 RepID=UPI001B05995A|nr:hypothetical protein [Catellatospora sp. TT07R-123]GHJ45914.1 hypothetical protein Cs7R123_32560 [Catellatospora sp. TT07R-123]